MPSLMTSRGGGREARGSAGQRLRLDRDVRRGVGEGGGRGDRLVDVDGDAILEAADDERLLADLDRPALLLAPALEGEADVELDARPAGLLGEPVPLVDVGHDALDVRLVGERAVEGRVADRGRELPVREHVSVSPDRRGEVWSEAARGRFTSE